MKYLLPIIAFLHLMLTASTPVAALEDPKSQPLKIALSKKQIEADYLRQEAVRNAAGKTTGKITPEQDAAGGNDGVINGEWGFHTANETNPWWQVDLGKPVALDRVVLYNRVTLAARNERIVVSLSEDGASYKQAYQHDGTVFLGFTDKKPLSVDLRGATARFVRLQLQAKSYFHLDEVEVYPAGSDHNIALGKPASQSSTSQWSSSGKPVQTDPPFEKSLERGIRLAASFRRQGVDVDKYERKLKMIVKNMRALPQSAPAKKREALFLEGRRVIRKMSLANPLLDFDSILFVKRAPAVLPHMSDQYYGWWSRPGGGIFILEGFKSGSPQVRDLTPDLPEGAYLRPDLSHDGKKLLFAYCAYHPEVADMEKVDKEKLPEDGFHHIYEMRVDGTGLRRLTRGRYDDFDARYLPNGDIVFLSTRKGQFIQTGKAGAQATTRATLPDSYVRCGGDNKRPCAVFTLHAMGPDGRDLRAISAFENFEWTPSIANDGRILYARWDYIDRFNGHFMSLWSTNQDGTNAQLVFGNYTKSPQCFFEARAIPGSQKLVFTASAHHSITGGSLALLDRTKGSEGEAAITRLTPEVRFPEAEGWQNMYYANPYPLSEEFFLVAWSDRRLPPHKGGGQVRDERNPVNALGLYLYDAFGNLELLHRDPEISSMYPIPVRSREKEPVHPDDVDWEGRQEGRFLVQDVYRGLDGIERGSVARLRIVGVPPKTQPHMNQPVLGVSKEDPGKFVLGTVPVERDGSAHFRVPSGIPLFFQALDRDGMAVQTMRSLTYVQPNRTLSCIGCHESRDAAPPVGATPLAARRAPSRIAVGPEGTWPLRFDRLVQPVLDKSCVQCHSPDGEDAKAARLDLTAEKAYQNLLTFAEKDLEKLAFERDQSRVGDCTARKSKLLAILNEDEIHQDLPLAPGDLERLIVWMDVYAQKQGSFSPRQEEQLRALRLELTSMLEE